MEAPPVQDDFLISLKFQNNLPNAPSGPFLKNINILQSLNEFPEFRTSTLEKGYVWQPHFGLDLGVKVDLVDQDAILLNEKNGPVLDQSDLKYLTGTGDKSRGKTKHIDQSSKPWWLRNTTYMENNLYNVGRVKAIAAESAKEISAKRKPDINYNIDMFSTAFINDSFDLTAKTVANLVAKNTKAKLVRDMPVVPLEYEELDVLQFFDKSHSLVRFDEDPTVAASNGTDGNDSSSSSSSQQANKKRKVDNGLITNLRTTIKSEELKNAVNLEVSLVSPLVTSTSEVAENETLYGWVKDYRMDVQHSKLTDSFLFVYQNAGTGGVGTGDAVQYFPITARVDMKKMNPEESLPHECIVVKE